MTFCPKLSHLIALGVEETLKTPEDFRDLDQDLKLVSGVVSSKYNVKILQIGYLLQLMADFCRRLADDDTFKEELEKAGVANYLWEKLILDQVPRLRGEIIRVNDRLAYKQLLDSLFQLTCKEQGFFRPEKYGMWKCLSKLGSELKEYNQGLILLEWASLIVPLQRWMDLKPLDEVYIMEFDYFDHNLRREVVFSSLALRSSTVKLIVAGVEQAIRTSLIIPKVAEVQPTIRSSNIKANPEDQVYFYDYRYGWMQGTVIALRLEASEKGLTRELLTVAVDGSSCFTQNLRLHHHEILQQLGLEPELFLDGPLDKLEVVLDSRSVYYSVSPIVLNFGSRFTLAIDYELFSLYKKPSDIFFNPSGFIYCQRFKFKKYLFLNKTFESIPPQKFVEHFVKLVQDNLDKFCNELGELIYFVVIHLEPSLLADGYRQLLDLMLYINRRIRQDELPIATNEMVFFGLAAFKALLLRILPLSIALKAAKFLLLETVKDLRKSQFINLQAASLTYWLFPHIFETSSLTIDTGKDILITSDSNLNFKNEGNFDFILSEFIGLAKKKQDSETIDASIAFFKKDFYADIRERLKNWTAKYYCKIDLEFWMREFEPVIMYDIDKSAAFLCKKIEDDEDYHWTVAILKMFLRYKNSARIGNKICVALKRAGSIEKLIEFCHCFVGKNISNGLYDKSQYALTYVQTTKSVPFFANLIIRVIMKFNGFNDSLTASALIKLFDILVFFLSKPLRYYDFRMMIASSDSNKRTAVSHHIAEVCLGLLHTNKGSRYFLFEVFGDMIITSAKEKLAHYTDESSYAVNYLINLEESFNRSHPFAYVHSSIENNAVAFAIERLRKGLLERAYLRTPSSIVFARESLHRLDLFWNLFVFGPSKGYFVINDHLSIQSTLENQNQTTSCLSRFRIEEKVTFRSKFSYCSIGEHLVYDSETNHLTKFAVRLVKRFGSLIAPSGWFEIDSFVKFYIRTMRNSYLYERMFGLEDFQGEHAIKRVFSLLDPSNTGKFPCKLLLEKCFRIITKSHEINQLFEFQTKMALLKKKSDFQIPNFQSRRFGVDVRPFYAQLNFPTLDSISLNLESLASPADQPSNTLIAACAKKVIRINKVRSQIYVRLRRKADQRYLLSVQLTEIK